MSDFRERITQNDRADRLLDLALARLKDAGLVRERTTQRTDSIIVLTTSSAEEDILRSYRLHANTYVTKPVDLDHFMSAIRQIDEFFLTVVKLPRR